MNIDGPLARLRLLQLVSPNLPVGAFAYSQGLEYAVVCGWVRDPDTLEDWLRGLMTTGLQRLDAPVLARLYAAAVSGDLQAFDQWSAYLSASRETAELRQEERQRARALTTLLPHLHVNCADAWLPALKRCQAAPFALTASVWGVCLEHTALGYVWGWLENQTAAAVKLVPLGQTQGQQIQFRLAAAIPDLVAEALALPDEAIGASAPAAVMASCLHETQYTRLFRS